MKRRGLVFLLLSGCVLVSHLQPEGVIRRFHAIEQTMNWTDAQRYCREKFTDLATIQDQTQNTEAQRLVMSRSYWIGLFKSHWQWSEDKQQPSTHAWFDKWALNEPRLKCVTIYADGDWFTDECKAQHYVLCSRADCNKHILVKRKMNWFDAQKFCRSKYADLSSIRSGRENKVIAKLLRNGGGDDSTAAEDCGRRSSDENVGGTASSAPSEAWIGLRVNYWEWSDRSNVSYTQWADDQTFNERVMCVKMKPDAKWYDEPCTKKYSFLCHSDVRKSTLRSVKVRLSGGSADLDDPRLQDAILPQLKQRLKDAGIREEVKLRWRRQPDGKVFHREEEEEEKERAPPCDQEQETVIEY